MKYSCKITWGFFLFGLVIRETDFCYSLCCNTASFILILRTYIVIHLSEEVRRKDGIVQLDFFTLFMTIGVILAAVSLSVLVFSFTRWENLRFLWASSAGILLAAAAILGSLRNTIPDFFSIILFNFFVISALLSFCELFSRMLEVRTRLHFFLFTVPFLMSAVLFVYTYYIPDYQVRVMVFNFTTLIPLVYTLLLLARETFRTRLKAYFLAALPFLFMAAVAIAKLIIHSFHEHQEFTSPLHFLLNALSMLGGLWAILSSVLLVGNILQKQLEEAARVDPLTGIMNRRYLQQSLLREIDHSHRKNDGLSIILCDIDHFKDVNDRHGHLIGDAVLVHTVNVFREHLRPDAIIARYGGEEFLFVLSCTGTEAGCLCAERLRKAVHETPFHTKDGVPITISCSFGVATLRHGVDTYESLLHRSDDALYTAKRAGRDQVFCAE